MSPANRARLEAIITKAVWCARIVLATVDGDGTNAIMQLTGKSKPCVSRWQERYVEKGVDGLLCDKTRPPGRKPLSAAVKRKVLSKTASEMPPNATHWSARPMAKVAGISRTSVQRIWAEVGLKPHLVRRFKISNDPQLGAKVTDVVELCLNPSDRALVLCVDEKSQIQALGSHPAGVAVEEGKRGDDDPRLQAQRHHDAVRRARREDGACHRRVSSLAPCPAALVCRLLNDYHRSAFTAKWR